MAQQQVPPGLELGVKHVHQAPPGIGVEVDHHVAAENDVQLVHQGGALGIQQVHVAEGDPLPHLTADLPAPVAGAVEVDLAIAGLGGPEGRLGVDAGPGTGDDPAGDVAAEHPDVPSAHGRAPPG